MMLNTIANAEEWFVTESKFEDKLAALETELSVTIVRPKRFLFLEEPSKQYPTIELLAAESEPEYAGLDSAASYGYDYDEMVFEAYHSSNNREEVRDTLLYYDLAVQRIIKDDFTFGNRFNRVRRGVAAFSDMYQLKEGGQEPYLQILRRTLVFRSTFEERSDA